jgi:hypothetical protein
MTSFIKHLPIQDNWTPVFRFTPIYKLDCFYYFITVMDAQRKLSEFRMYEQDGDWKIRDAGLIPDFIWAAETRLSSAILEHQ